MAAVSFVHGRIKVIFSFICVFLGQRSVRISSFFAKKYAKTREIFEFIRDIRGGGGIRFEFREASFPSFLKKSAQGSVFNGRGL